MIQPVAVIGFVLCEDYSDMVAVCEDMPDPDFDTWKRRQLAEVEAIHAQGIQVVQVNIKPLEMAAWCKANGKKVNGIGRAAYSSFVCLGLNKRSQGACNA